MSFKRPWYGTQEQNQRWTQPRLSGDWNRAVTFQPTFQPAPQAKGHQSAFQPAGKAKGKGKKGRHAGQYLVIMDMNGVLMKRSGGGNQNVTMRPHLEEFLKVLSELSESFSVAVWSSMMMHNLEPLVNKVFGELAPSLQFIWDQNSCTKCWVPEMRKPLFRKDLAWLHSTPWASYMPDRVLLIDDDAIKCTANQEGTAIHPSSFEGCAEGDVELLHLAEYLKTLAETADNSVPAFVTSYTYDAFKEVHDMPNEQLEDSGTGEAADDLVEVEIEDDGDNWATDQGDGQYKSSGPVEAADDLVEVEIEEDGQQWDAQHEEVPIEDDGCGSLEGADDLWGLLTN